MYRAGPSHARFHSIRDHASTANRVRPRQTTVDSRSRRTKPPTEGTALVMISCQSFSVEGYAGYWVRGTEYGAWLVEPFVLGVELWKDDDQDFHPAKRAVSSSGANHDTHSWTNRNDLV